MVWSDPKIQKLAEEFVTVTEEVHFIFPEGTWALEQIKDNPAHKFFKKYGEAMPEGVWYEPGTKQGIYMMGPNAEYLEGAGALSGEFEKIQARLERALKRWKELAQKKRYSNKPIPKKENPAPPFEKKKDAMVLRVFLRDLPSRLNQESGRRFEPSDIRGIWPHFVQWAWNVNWLVLDDPKSLVPRSRSEVEVSNDTFRKICREVLVDNVRGQNPHWQPEHIKLATLSMKRVKSQAGLISIEYRGRATMDSGSQKYAPTLFGKAQWNTKKKRFQSFELLAIGPRSGRGRFNQRNTDLGPAPMGVLLRQFEPLSSK